MLAVSSMGGIGFTSAEEGAGGDGLGDSSNNCLQLSRTNVILSPPCSRALSSSLSLSLTFKINPNPLLFPPPLPGSSHSWLLVVMRFMQKLIAFSGFLGFGMLLQMMVRAPDSNTPHHNLVFLLARNINNDNSKSRKGIEMSNNPCEQSFVQ